MNYEAQNDVICDRLLKKNRMTAPQEAPAAAVTLLLSNHEHFGLRERALYHWDLMEAVAETSHDTTTITATATKSTDDTISLPEQQLLSTRTDLESVIPSSSNNNISIQSCGIVALLECNSNQRSKRKSRVQKKLNKENAAIAEFNQKAKGRYGCYQPRKLPLRVTLDTRVVFAYERVRMVFVIDASPTLTATYGNMGTSPDSDDDDADAICALDRLESMARSYFTGLVQPVNGTVMSDQHGVKRPWTPSIEVTVVAVYPKIVMKKNTDYFSTLVQDFHVHNEQSAFILSERISEWAMSEVESVIADRLSTCLDSFSSLEHILDVSDLALYNFASYEGRPCVTIATDCRAIHCDDTIDFVKYKRIQEDCPVHILDLSGSRNYVAETSNHSSPNQPHYMSFDYNESRTFPLNIPNGAEALYNICKITKGCFFNSSLLMDALKSKADNVTSKSTFWSDSYFSSPKRIVLPSALQWYTIFTLSPFCQITDPQWGHIPPPTYVRRHDPSNHVKREHVNNYSVLGLKLKGLAMMRILDGYRPAKYAKLNDGQHKTRIEFILPLDCGLKLHYEVWYPKTNERADIKILLSGEHALVKMVKNNYIQRNISGHFHPNLSSSVMGCACEKVCRFLEWQKSEDKLEARLCPVDWEDDFTKNSPLFNLLSGELSKYQIRRHFRTTSFEVIDTSDSQASVLSGNKGVHSGEKQLFRTLKLWSSHIISAQHLYMKKVPLPCSESVSIPYCLIKVERTNIKRIFKIQICCFERIDTNTRLSIVASFQESIRRCELLVIVAKPISPFIVPRPQTTNTKGVQNSSEHFRVSVENLYQNRTWNLSHDPELLSLIKSRRILMDDFILLDDNENQSYALFSKYVSDECDEGLHLLQYRIQTEEMKNTVTVDIFMNQIKSDFNYRSWRETYTGHHTLFAGIYEKIAECDNELDSHLSSLRNLLHVFEKDDSSDQMDHQEDIKRVVNFSVMKASRKLRFFQSGGGDDCSDLSGQTPNKGNLILENLTLDLILSDHFECQTVRLTNRANDSTEGKGSWFLVRHSDSSILTLVHFPTDNNLANEEYCQCDRTVNFYTANIRRFYRGKSDIMSTSSTEKIPEHQFTLDFSDALVGAHEFNYAYAAYLALRKSDGETTMSFCPEDFQEVLKPCSFMKVAGILIDQHETSFGNDHDTTNYTRPDSKLISLIQEMLSPIPGGDNCFFFHMSEADYKKYDSAIQLQNKSTYHHEYGHTIEEEVIPCEYSQEASTYTDEESLILPPLFVSFSLDGKAVALDDLSSIENSTYLEAKITFFNQSKSTGIKEFEFNPSELPGVHLTLAIMLCSRLNSFVAEQKLERLRKKERQDLVAEDMNTIKQCLQEAENLSTEKIPAYLYFTQKDLTIDASTTLGTEADLQLYYSLLCKCLENQTEFSLDIIKEGEGEYFVFDNQILGWCHISIQRSFDAQLIHLNDLIGKESTDFVQYSTVLIHVYDSSGKTSASSTCSQIKSILARQIHRVNQIILLKALHRTRTSSSLLIPIDEETSSSTDLEFESDTTTGKFRCDVKHRMSYPLNEERFKVSRARNSLSAILESFAVSNRPDFFVYIDEEDQIFYMKLGVIAGEEGSISLLVYGDQQPGESITEQLNGLLAKTLMTNSLEVLDSLLLKNSHFPLETSDMDFLENFESNWLQIAKNDNAVKCPCNEKFYEFPCSVYDPVLVMVYFRQNISGSSFFNILNVKSEENKNVSDGVTDIRDEDMSSDKHLFRFDPQEFSLYFISSQRQDLDPNYQPVLTLTQAGQTFARDAGTGIALVEINLLDSNNVPVQYINVGINSDDQLGVNCDFSRNSIRFLKKNFNEPFDGHYRLKIKIVNTTLNVDALHSWIELTLNQALSSWFVEQHIEKVISRKTSTSKETQIISSNQRLNHIESACYGLSKLGQILLYSSRLPHPGMKTIEFKTNVKSTELSVLTMHLLEKGLLQLLFNDRKIQMVDVPGLKIIRVNEKGIPQVVHLSRGNRQQDSCDVFQSSKKVVDTPIESIQYLVVYGLSSDTAIASRPRNSREAPSASSFLFQKVYVDDHVKGTDSLSNALKKLEDGTSSALYRRIAFTLRVTRRSISALVYNWNPTLTQTAFDRLQEINASYVAGNRQRCKNLQTRCLGDVESLNIRSPKVKPTIHAEKKVETYDSKGKPNENKLASPTLKRPEIKSSSIRKPKLVGQPNKGSAIHAAAFRRKNASSSRNISGGITRSSTVTRSTSIQKSTVYKSKDISANRKTKTNGASSQSIKRDKKSDFFDYLPPAVLHEYHSLNNLPISQKAAGAALSQSLFMNWMISLCNTRKTIELPFKLIHSILDHGIPLGSQAFQLVGSSIVSPSSFLSYAVKKLSNGGTIILRNFGQGDTLSSKDSGGGTYSIYAIKQILPLKATKAVTVFELVMSRNKKFGMIGHSRCWLFIGIEDKAQDAIAKKKVKCSLHRERESTVLNNAAYILINQTQSYWTRCQSEVFNYTSILLRKRIKQIHTFMDIPMILRETMHLFPVQLQQSLCGIIWHRIFHHSLCIDKHDLSVGSWFTPNLLLEQLLGYASFYNLVDCSKNDDKGLIGILPSMKDVYFFLLINNEEFSSSLRFELFVLCATYGRSIDAFVFDGVSPYAKRLSEHIICCAETYLLELFRKAIVDLHRDMLWDQLSNTCCGKLSNASIIPEKDKLLELRTMSNLVSVSKLDPRFMELLINEASDLNVDWSKAFTAIVGAKLFSNHCDIKLHDSMIHLFYFQKENLFLIMELNSDGIIESGTILGRSGVNEDTFLISAQIIVQNLATWFLLWIYDNT